MRVLSSRSGVLPNSLPRHLCVRARHRNMLSASFCYPVSIGSCFLKRNELKIQILIEDKYP